MKRFQQITKLFVGAAMLASVATPAFAETTLHSTSSDSDRVNMDIGVSVGTPGGINLGVTKWGIGSVPLLVRGSGTYLGENFWGFQPEVGVAFDTEGLFRQYVAVAYTRSNLYVPSRGVGLTWEGFGPVYGINWGGFMAQLGLSFGKGTSTDDFVVRQITTPQLVAQVGYAFYF